ncbi:endospore germination permease [Paenibacillus sp. HJL G12]|uniref:Endospore germination permease n=1 Tax=Paenibacillus dendrobii TaxID=2691084 RepID=A0A7X3IP67_9BACL|nr:endospore germination permease [Paenibacillus dendrobii]MWV45692.1 endospore germination permease [Paenibacillus dendrobii]
MLEKGKISSAQMAFMLFAAVVGTVILSIPAISGTYAKNDVWISPIWASFAGLIAIMTAYKLQSFYPKLTIIQYAARILGPFPGKLLGLAYLLFYIVMNGHGVRIYADFIVGTTLPRTPLIILVATMILLCTLAVRGGIEGIGRAAQIIVPGYMIAFIALILLILPNCNAEHLFPILEHGLTPSLQGSIPPQGWFAEFFLISFLLPFLSDKKKAKKWSWVALITTTLTLVVTNLVILCLFGRNISSYTYPLLTATRYISLADFFENVESVITAIWVIGNFVKFSVVHYALVLGTAQWLNLSDYRPVAWPIGILTIIISFWSMPSQMALSHYTTFVFPFYSLLFQTLIPALLLLIAYIRMRDSKGDHSS